MNLLPKASGTRPRVACDISPQGVVAARSADTASAPAAVARVHLAEGAVVASLKPGNVVDRVAVTAAVLRALESIGERPNAHGSNITLIVPDQAVRVLLLEFDALPAKLTEALSIVRFRLKKMLPFDADDAMVTYQVMSASKQMVRVLAVAVPRDVLSEYETAVREAGFEPGAVIPSTLAALAAVDGESPELLINANDFGVTAAIVRGGILMLHRSVDLQMQLAGASGPGGEAALQEGALPHEYGAPVAVAPMALGEEIAQAVSVAAAYFEDTLAQAPERILSAGPLGADALGNILVEYGVAQADGLRVHELVDAVLLLDAPATNVPAGWMSGVVGALRG